jgi:hypothetical protein
MQMSSAIAAAAFRIDFIAKILTLPRTHDAIDKAHGTALGRPVRLAQGRP